MKGYQKVHHIAHCQDCKWEEGDYIIASKEANKHFKKTGHTIDIEIGLCKQLRKIK